MIVFRQIISIKMIAIQISQSYLISSLKFITHQMNNNSSLSLHCFSCGRELQTNQTNIKFQKHQYPVCNQTTDIILIEKHFMCLVCQFAFQSIKQFAQKHDIKWFNKDFKIQKIIDSNFIKMSHIETSFTKQNNRKSQILQTTSIKKSEDDTQDTGQKEGLNLNISLPNDIYNAIINDNIESNYFHHVFWLPKPVQYMIKLSSSQKMRPEQRKQRIKKILQILSYFYCIDEQQLKYLAIVVHTMICFMDQELLLKLLDRLLRSFLKNSISIDILIFQQKLETRSFDKSFEQRHFNKKSIQLRPDKILQTVFSILILSDFFKDGRLKKHIKEIISFSLEQMTQDWSHTVDRMKNLQKTYQNYIKTHISDSASKLPKLSSTTWNELVEVKKQKNQLNLIIKTIKSQQQENQEIIKEMQNKYKKQKDQYVNKIVKLGNKISELEGQIKILKEKKSESEKKQTKLKNHTKFKEDDDEVKSNPQMKSNEKPNLINKQQGNQQQITEASQAPFIQKNCLQQIDRKKHKSEVEVLIHEPQVNGKQNQDINYLKSIFQITDIVSFNCKIHKKSSSFPISELPNSVKQLSQIIITEINILEKKVSSLKQQNKKYKQQSSRILSILTGKQEKWMALFHQKDELIALYQRALLCLENGIILSQQPLSSRIQAILDKVSKIKIFQYENNDQDNSMRDSFVQEVLDIPLPNKKQSQNNKSNLSPSRQKNQSNSSSTSKKQIVQNGVNIKKKAKKEKQKQSQCQIY